ncbi:MAG: hypothetical protein C0407_08935 [Desulfobacca sp.]|nr:hypothetical protein [Desulfobacca sp.]
MKRRDFLKTIGGLSALALCPSDHDSYASPAPTGGKPPVSDRPTKVFLAGLNRGASEENQKSAVLQAALAASDFSWLAKGDTVFIKPALNSGKPYPFTTSPVALSALIELVKKKGAGRVIVGDMAGIGHVKLSPEGLSGSTRKLMEANGMAKAVQAVGGEIHFFEESGWPGFYEDPMTKSAHWKGSLMMPKILKEVDHIILMPRCGRHVLAGSTLGLKSAVGYWRTDTRLEYHRDAASFHEKTAEANTAQTLLRKQRLVITAADKILTTFGPDDGTIHHPELGLIIASESIVAHDMVSLAWLLETRGQIPADQKNGFFDNSPLVAGLGNRWVVGKLGGWGQALSAEKLIKNNLQTIWDDRVLNHAFRIFGGTPRVIINTANRSLPAELINRLSTMITS